MSPKGCLPLDAVCYPPQPVRVKHDLHRPQALVAFRLNEMCGPDGSSFSSAPQRWPVHLLRVCYSCVSCTTTAAAIRPTPAQTTVMLMVFMVLTGGTHIRARLSPSLATGLVGLRENAYIGDFFNTMGFLPFTTERWV